MRKNKILITGINGFAASHLARRLVKEKNSQVFGTVRVRSDRHRLATILDKIELKLCELTDAHSVNAVIQEVQPDEIYHLAAQSYVKSSWETPLETMNINYGGTINVLEAVRKLDYKPAILITSTSEIYGHIKGIIDENTFPYPNTPYGISKLAQEQIAMTYQRAFAMKLNVSRSFNITGEGRADVFVDSNFAKQIAMIEAGKQEPVIRHGNLESARDFVDVEDVIDGYIRIMRSGKEGEIYCLASGSPTRIQTILDVLISLSKNKNIKTELDPQRMRPIDTPTMQGNSNKIRKDLQWLPEKTLHMSLEELLNYWRKQI